MLGVFDIFKIGVGPSSSHTVGPMRIAARSLQRAEQDGVLNKVARIQVELQGSLALTGLGHASDRASMLGLMGADPETLDPDEGEQMLEQLRATHRLTLPNGREILFDPALDLEFRGDISPELHPNGMRILMRDGAGTILLDRVWYSVGGGFIASAQQLTSPSDDDLILGAHEGALPFASGAELLQICADRDISIADIMLINEDAQRPRADTEAGLMRIWSAMSDCIERGLRTEGELPGGLHVKRRAAGLYARLKQYPEVGESEHLFDWLNVFAMAVNEENAAGGRVVTAPTNGAAGLIPAVIRYYCAHDGWCEDDVSGGGKIATFLLTSAAIGILYKQRASISGAEMGCQGEVGVACSMAAAGLAAIWGGTPMQVERAAEIGMEHNLGLTCDPVGGLVQIPCIERNAIGAVKAANAARLAIRASDTPHVSLDQVIETMRQTGLDMSTKYKETSQGGLAVNVIEC